ncbi:hypothetical protein QZH41_011135, partial [Actinostola sp. cb2023]
DGKKLEVTLHINNVTISDDSAKGGYECHGYTGAKSHPYGFTVSVIRRVELPGIEVSKDQTVEFGDNIVLSCNLTTNTKASHYQTKLSKLMWAKDGKIIDEVLYPKEQSLKSRVLKVTEPQDGGIYSCHLISKLRDVKEYNITGNVTVTVKPKFFAKDLKDNKIKIFKEENAIFRCSAKGNPLKTEWQMKLKGNGKMQSFDLSANNSDYKFSKLDDLEDHTLTIPDADYTDRGKYYCCIQTANYTRNQGDVDGCQIFILRVK